MHLFNICPISWSSQISLSLSSINGPIVDLTKVLFAAPSISVHCTNRNTAIWRPLTADIYGMCPLWSSAQSNSSTEVTEISVWVQVPCFILDRFLAYIGFSFLFSIFLEFPVSVSCGKLSWTLGSFERQLNLQSVPSTKMHVGLCKLHLQRIRNSINEHI